MKSVYIPRRDVAADEQCLYHALCRQSKSNSKMTDAGQSPVDLHPEISWGNASSNDFQTNWYR